MIGFLAAVFVLNTLGCERSAALDTIANLGVTLLLFTIGLKLAIKTLLKTEVWALASLQIVGATLLLAGALFILKLFGLAMAAELGWTVMVLLGFALSFSSTVFAVKVLDAPTRPSGAHPRSRLPAASAGALARLEPGRVAALMQASGLTVYRRRAPALTLSVTGISAATQRRGWS